MPAHAASDLTNSNSIVLLSVNADRPELHEFGMRLRMARICWRCRTGVNDPMNIWFVSCKDSYARVAMLTEAPAMTVPVIRLTYRIARLLRKVLRARAASST